MTAKHHAPQPKRRRSTDDLEKRVRRIERNYQRDIAKAVEHAYEAGRREERKHAIGVIADTCSWPAVPGATSYNIYDKTDVTERTIRPPGKSSKPEGPRAQKET